LLQSIANIFKVPDLKRKVLFTTFLLVIYRLGSFIPTPGVNAAVLKQIFSSQQGAKTLFGLYDLFAGGNFSRASIFALGIMPYITSSIVIQMLGSIFPYFEKLKKEGADGQRKIQQFTKYGTIVLCIFQSIGMAFMLIKMENGAGVSAVSNPGFLFILTTVVTMSAGTMFIMWIGDQITESGIGNGISLIIFAGIIARYPKGFYDMGRMVQSHAMSIFNFVLVIIVMLIVTAAVILVTEAVRKIPVQYAKRVVGRKVYGGQNTHIPLRVNTAGVIPIIFAQSVIMFPRTIATFFPDSDAMGTIVQWLSPGAFLYTLIYVTLIIFFAYFYTAIVLNPVEMAENMKRYGGFIPGRAPGKKTSDYINSVLTRITLPGAIFFAAIAVLPQFLQKYLNIPFYFGGTGLIIVVGVALDTLQQIESHLVMRHYDGFMKKGKLKGRFN